MVEVMDRARMWRVVRTPPDGGEEVWIRVVDERWMGTYECCFTWTEDRGFQGLNVTGWMPLSDRIKELERMGRLAPLMQAQLDLLRSRERWCERRRRRRAGDMLARGEV